MKKFFDEELEEQVVALFAQAADEPGIEEDDEDDEDEEDDEEEDEEETA